MQNISTKDLEVVTGGARSRTNSSLTDQNLQLQLLQQQLTTAQTQNQNDSSKWMPLLAIAALGNKKNSTVAAGPGYFSYSA